MNIKTIGLAVLAGAMIAGCEKNEEKAAQEDVMAVSVSLWLSTPQLLHVTIHTITYNIYIVDLIRP